MLSHAAKVNYDKMQERIESDRRRKDREREKDRRDPKMSNGKRVSEMGMDELLVHLRGDE